MTTRKEEAHTALIQAFMKGAIKHMSMLSCAASVLARYHGSNYAGARNRGVGGYNFAHMKSIERAFEQYVVGAPVEVLTNRLDNLNDPDCIIGLSHVFDTLDKIDPEATTSPINTHTLELTV